MAAIPPDGPLRSAFKNWALNIIKSTPNHALRFLIDPKTGTWYPNRINYPADPSVDAGHTVSKWTGLPTYFALEDSDYNRNFNRGENRTREGAFYNKQVVLIDRVPVELRTAQMYENTNKLPRGTVQRALKVDGAWKSPTGNWSVSSTPAIRPSGMPSARSSLLEFEQLSRARAFGRALVSNENAVALLGTALGSLSTWLNELGIARNVQQQLQTERADEIAKIHARGEGALIVVRVQSYDGPDEFHLPNASLMGISILGGANFESALARWIREPKIMTAPWPMHRVDETYSWLASPTISAEEGYTPSDTTDSGKAKTDSPKPETVRKTKTDSPKPHTIPVAPLR